MLKVKNNYLSFLLLLTIYATHIWINFFYNSTNNVDFSKYYDFLNYFLGLNVTLDYGQGLVYYYLISLLLKRNIDLINLGSIDIVITSSVHDLNLFLFAIGLWGLYKLLLFNNYDKKISLLCLILLNFFPQSIYIRAVMKPEILAFALFPWCVLFIEMFLKSKNIRYIYFAIPPLVIIVNSKASLAAMAVMYFLIFYYEVFKIIKLKQLFILILVFLSLVLTVQIENYNITELNPFERVYEEEYDYKANPSILFRTNLIEVFRNPYFKYDYQDNFYSIHAKSIINLTILDTFGDHFNQLFDSSINYFSKNRKTIFIEDSNSLINDNRQVKYNGPLSFFLANKLDLIRKTISSLMSIIFYILIIYFSFKQKRKRKYLLAPFIGIIVLYVNSLGFPSNNFNPFKGDTFKSFYYSFFLIIALAVLVCELFKKNKYLINAIATFIFCILILFISGHPKANDQLTSERIIITNEYSVLCEINNLLFLENDILKMIHPTGNIENYKSDCKNYSISQILNKQNFQDYKNLNSQLCFKENSLIVDKSNSKECRIFWINEAQAIDQSNNQKPIFSLIMFISSLIIFLINTKKIENYFLVKKKKY